MSCESIVTWFDVFSLPVLSAAVQQPRRVLLPFFVRSSLSEEALECLYTGSPDRAVLGQRNELVVWGTSGGGEQAWGLGACFPGHGFGSPRVSTAF